MTTPASERGLAYLRVARSLAPDTTVVNMLATDSADRERIAAWIGTHIDAVNHSLHDCLQACHECFHPWQRHHIRVLAVPLCSAANISGICNILQNPIPLLIDVGRVEPTDWLALVAHEYAHAHVNAPGHHPDFVATLSHLCLGLGLPLPATTATEAEWRAWPPCQLTSDPLRFWRGESDAIAPNVTDYYSPSVTAPQSSNLRVD